MRAERGWLGVGLAFFASMRVTNAPRAMGVPNSQAPLVPPPAKNGELELDIARDNQKIPSSRPS